MMKVAFAFLCNFVDRLQDGRVVIVGADLDTVEAGSFPSSVPLALVATLIAPDGESNGDRRLRVEVTVPGGERRPVSEDRLIHAVRRSDGTLAYQFAATLSMTFERPGGYAFHVIESNNEMATIPLTVCQSRGALSPSSSTNARNDDEEWNEVDALAPSDEELEKLADLLPAPAEWYHEA